MNFVRPLDLPCQTPYHESMDEPIVIIAQKSFFQTKKGKALLATIIALVIFVILAIGLPFLLKKPVTDPSGIPVKITLIPGNYGFKAGTLTLSCPVDSASCPSRKLVTINNSSAVTYQAASQSSVLNVSELPNLENMAVSENTKTGKKYFYESVVKDQNSCYTIAYTLPGDAAFGAILDLPVLNTGSKIATLGSKTFQVERQDVNVLIQVRNTPMDPSIPCSLIKKSPNFFKAFN